VNPDFSNDPYADLITDGPLRGQRGRKSQTRYPATRFLISIIRITGIAVLLCGLGGALISFSLSELNPFFALGTALAAFLYFVLCFASAEGLKLLVDMEEHQRAIRARIEQRVN
jgi:hypothetical protein